MTRAMRWRVGAFTIVGTFAIGAFGASFIGCGDDDDAPVTDTDTGIPGGDTGTDTAKPDTGGGETVTETSSETTPGDADADAPAPKPDRQVTILFGQPDNPATGLFVCLGAFASDPTAAAKPVQAIGPAGIPDSTAPTDPTKYKGFGFGSVLPFPVDTDAAKAALTSLTVVAYFLESNPLTATPASTCADQWATVKADTKRWFKVDPGKITAGKSFVLALSGCKNPATSPIPQACGTGTTDNREFTLAELGATTAAAGTFNAQFMHLSQFPGVAGTVPSFQNVDVYIQPMKAGTAGDAGDGGADVLADVLGDVLEAGDTAPSPVPAGTMIALGGVGGTGLNYKDLVTPAVAVTLPAGTDPDLSFFVIAPHGSTPCLGGPTATCAAYTLPAKPYLAAYKAAGGGWTAGTNQLMWLLGSAIPPTGATTPTIIMGMSNSKAGW